MTLSLRYFILLNLLLGELLATVLGISTILFLEHRDIRVHTDNTLLTSVFIMQNAIDKKFALKEASKFENIESINTIVPTEFYKYKEDALFNADMFASYIWGANGKLLFGEKDFNAEYFSHVPLGFSDIKYKNESWRIFTTIDPLTKIKILVSQRVDLQEISLGKIAQDFITIVLTSYLFIGLFMWFILSKSLRELKKISDQVNQQGPDHLSSLDSSKLPTEIRPIVEEWNKLSERLKLAFIREKRFAADAAHELKTPLAALKTHTQLALNAKNESELVNALHKIVLGVNRSAHVVNQLLTLNQMSQSGMVEIPATPVDIVKLAKEILSDLVPQALEKDTDIELIAPDTPLIIEAHDTAISILIRNLVDNSIRYSPKNSLIQVVLEETSDKKGVVLKVIDNGCGIPEELRQRVFERFFRVIGNKTSGSGLGLGIVQQIVDLHHASISLETPANGKGLQIAVLFFKENS
jgi:two-component system sensor histidine kinase QseC